MKIIVTILIVVTSLVIYKYNKEYQKKISTEKKYAPYIRGYNNKKEELNKLKNNHTYNYIMIGDSITAGANWNKLLLRNDVLNMGQGGDQLAFEILDEDYGVLNRLEGLDFLYKKAFVMIGINDLSTSKNVADVFDNYVKFLNKIRENKIEPVVQSTLHMTENKFGLDYKAINIKVEELNFLLKNYCEEQNILYININKELSKNKELIDKYTYDGLHLSDDGYNKLVKSIKKYFKVEEIK